MDQFDIQLAVEKRKAVLRALDELSEQFNQTLQNLIDEKHLSTEVPPTQLECRSARPDAVYRTVG